MRNSYRLLAGASAVLLAACGGNKKTAINDDLKNDLALASSSDGITLANSSPGTGQQVISAIERTTPPSRSVAPSTRVRNHKPAPKSPPHVVKTQAPATVVAQAEPQPVAPQPVASDPAPVSPRPQPVPVSYPSGPSSGGDNGSIGAGGAGAIIGTILGAVIRGGIVVGDGDNCDPRTEGGHRAVNQHVPTFPYPGGRIGSPMPRGGSSMPRGGIGSGMPRRRF